MTSQANPSSSPLHTQYADFCVTHPLCQALCGGHVWSYREGGPRHAPAVLLLPGALGRPETSFEYIAVLENHLRVLAPGYPATAQTMTDLADGAAQLLEKCGVHQAHIVGGSFGGLVAQALLDRHPNRVKRLVLSDTSPPVPARALRMLTAAFFIGLLPPGVVRATLRFGVSRYVVAMPPGTRQFWRQHFSEMLGRLTKAEVGNRARAWAEFDGTRFRPNGCPPPTLVLCAESDRAVSPDKLRARFPQAVVHVIASPLGHAASVGDAPAYLAPMLRFLTGADA